MTLFKKTRFLPNHTYHTYYTYTKNLSIFTYHANHTYPLCTKKMFWFSQITHITNLTSITLNPWPDSHISHALLQTQKVVKSHISGISYILYISQQKVFCLNTHITHITHITPNTWSKSRKQDYTKPHISNIFHKLDLTLKVYKSHISSKSHISHI